VVGVSPDPPETSARFRAELGLPYALVPDPDMAVARAWGAVWPLVNRVRRVTYVVARDGRIALAYWNELGFESHVEAVKAAL
jgi:peroxiredoxin Q/BCP